MSSDLDILMEMLKSRPGYALISSDGTRLFTLAGPEQKLMVCMHKTKNFNDMNETEINEFIQKQLS